MKQRHALFVLAVAVAVAGVAEWRRQATRDAVDHLREATAEVVEVRVYEKAPRYAVTARFAGPQGGWITVHERVSDAPAVGAHVAAWYDPRDPEETASLLRRNRYGTAVALYVAAGMIALLAAKVSRDIARREAREAASGATRPATSSPSAARPGRPATASRGAARARAPRP